MPTILQVHNDTATRLAQFPRWTDLVELDSAVAETYSVPADADTILINPVKQSDGSATSVYAMWGTNAIGSAMTGAAFGNQPANDGVEIVSDDAGDTTQTLTVYYTRDSLGDTVYSEGVALDGTNVVSLTDTDAALVLGVELDAVCAGTVTVREASGNATITTITTGNLQSGITTLTDTDAGSSYVRMVASDTSTKQIGLVGTGQDGSALLDSQALTNTTPVFSNSRFATVTKVLHGDLESNRTVSLTALAAFVPSADDSYGAAPVALNGASYWQVAGGSEISFVRADSSVTADVHISCWKKRSN